MIENGIRCRFSLGLAEVSVHQRNSGMAIMTAITASVMPTSESSSENPAWRRCMLFPSHRVGFDQADQSRGSVAVVGGDAHPLPVRNIGARDAFDEDDIGSIEPGSVALLHLRKLPCSASSVAMREILQMLRGPSLPPAFYLHADDAGENHENTHSHDGIDGAVPCFRRVH